MTPNENPVSPYARLVTISGDMKLLEALLENLFTLPEDTKGELEHFVHRINDRLFTVLDELDPPAA